MALSPLVTMIALSFWALCWGMTGMLLAIPSRPC
jgi:predicted PurR-regulated permease PerM